MAWTPIDDSETPSWSPISNPSATGAFQFGAFQPAYQVGTGSIWNPVNDLQSLNWQGISVGVGGSWTTINDSQNPGWH